MRYLELGVYDGKFHEKVQSRFKESVDVEKRYPNLTHHMSTDEFFKRVPEDMTWDLIYIDADHSCEAVRRDFNNAVSHLSHGGFIFLHDLWPPNEKWITPGRCGTAFRFLDALIRTDRYKMYTLNTDYGLTMVVDPTSQVDVHEVEIELLL